MRSDESTNKELQNGNHGSAEEIWEPRLKDERVAVTWNPEKSDAQLFGEMMRGRQRRGRGRGR